MLTTSRLPATMEHQVPNRPTHIFEELLGAARGTAAIVMGDHGAASYFDFSPRGLAGSFIAFLVANVVNAYLPALPGSPDDGLPVGKVLLVAVVLQAMQFAFSAIVLRQLARLDGFVPYMAAHNWAAFFITVILSILTVIGLPITLVFAVLAILALVIEVNIARLIVTLRFWQIVMLLIAQAVGGCIGLLVMIAVLPLPAGALGLPSG